jgi:3-hydroxyisobutyryl-CoA hydrolase
VDKTKERPKWSPSDIYDDAVSPSSIASKFFTGSSPHLKQKPALNFKPASSSKSSEPHDSTWGQFRRYGLPSETEVEAAVIGSSPGSGAFKITLAQLTERLVDRRGDAGGPRQKEVAAWIQGIVERNCVEKDGYLDWNPSKRAKQKAE